MNKFAENNEWIIEPNLIIRLEQWKTSLARGIFETYGIYIIIPEAGIKYVSLAQIPHIMGGFETETVGIYLQVNGNASRKVMMVMPRPDAHELVDWVVGQPGESSGLMSSRERATLLEVANMACSTLLKDVLREPVREKVFFKSAIMMDMLGAILDILPATAYDLSECGWLIQAPLVNKEREKEVKIWFITDTGDLFTQIDKAAR